MRRIRIFGVLFLAAGVILPGFANGLAVTSSSGLPSALLTTGNAAGQTTAGPVSYTSPPVTVSGGDFQRVFTGVRKGVASPENALTQDLLSKEGVYSGPITGYYGTLTQNAVKKFQQSMGLTVTGQVDAATQSALQNQAQQHYDTSSLSSGTTTDPVPSDDTTATTSSSTTGNLRIVTFNTEHAVLNHPYAQRFYASGGTPPRIFAWSLTGGTLPAGLSLQSSTGANIYITGTPTATGTATFTLTVSSNGQTVSRDFTVTVMLTNFSYLTPFQVDTGDALLSPAGAQTWNVGGTYTIRWTPVPGLVDVGVVRYGTSNSAQLNAALKKLCAAGGNGGTPVTQDMSAATASAGAGSSACQLRNVDLSKTIQSRAFIAQGVDGSTGSYTWKIPDSMADESAAASGQRRFKIVVVNTGDKVQSSGFIGINNEEFKILSPLAGESLVYKTRYTIRWVDLIDLSSTFRTISLYDSAGTYKIGDIEKMEKQRDGISRFTWRVGVFGDSDATALVWKEIPASFVIRITDTETNRWTQSGVFSIVRPLPTSGGGSSESGGPGSASGTGVIQQNSGGGAPATSNGSIDTLRRILQQLPGGGTSSTSMTPNDMANVLEAARAVLQSMAQSLPR